MKTDGVEIPSSFPQESQESRPSPAIARSPSPTVLSGGVVVCAVATPASAAKVVVFFLLLEAPVGQLRLCRRVRLVAVQLEELAEVVALQGEVKLGLIKI